jgi:hypothetical protein
LLLVMMGVCALQQQRVCRQPAMTPFAANSGPFAARALLEA